MQQLTQEILRLCREYGECRVEVERMEEARRVKNALESVCSMARQRLDISDPALLLALLDACEVTRDEGMLQEVLDVVGRNLDRLAVSGGKCEIAGLLLLLCGRRGMCGTGPKNAGGIEEVGNGEEELADAETILEELT